MALLNQRHGWLPSQVAIFDIAVEGQRISNDEVIRFSIGMCAAAVLWGVLSFTCSLKNWRVNRRACVDLREAKSSNR
jgi:hypothetical protein